jgi:hypothetical protein
MAVKKNACSGKGRITKGALLQMMGDKASNATFLYGQSLAEEKKDKILKVIEENGGKLNRAAVILGIRASSLQRWVKQWASETPKIPQDSPTTSTRSFYEGIRNPWSITSFDTATRDVCIEIKTPSSTNLLSFTIPNMKPADY